MGASAELEVGRFLGPCTQVQGRGCADAPGVWQPPHVISRLHHHHPHHQALALKSDRVSCFPFCKLWQLMEVDCDGPSSARRRRERRLRSWLRHERMTVAMALAEKLHHSAYRTHLPKKEEVEQDQALRGQTKASAREGEVHEKDDASRSQSTPHPGERPGLPPEPGPQRSDRTVRRSSGETPLLVVASLAAARPTALTCHTLLSSRPKRWKTGGRRRRRGR